MYKKELIDFFKRHNLYEKKMFDYLIDHTDMIDYKDEDARMFIGFGYMCDKDNKLQKFRICVPFVTDNKTMLISIHEIVHGIVGYKYLGKKFKPSIYIETLPILYEKIYIDEMNDPALYEYGKYLDGLIGKSEADEKYRYALYAREYLLNKYNKDFDHMERLSKKLVNKYKNDNK